MPPKPAVAYEILSVLTTLMATHQHLPYSPQKYREGPYIVLFFSVSLCLCGDCVFLASSTQRGLEAASKLAPGAYKFVVEASREVGGREVVSVPFQWPPAKAEQASASGSSELGDIRLQLKP